MRISSAPPWNDGRRPLAGLVLVILSLSSASSPTLWAQSPSFEQVREKLESGQLEEARRLAEASVRRSPRNPRSHLAFGTVLLFQGKAAEASKSFEFAAALDPAIRPQVGEAYLAAARAFAEPDPDRAQGLLTRAAEYDPALRQQGLEAFFGDAFERLRAGDETGRRFLSQWLARFPEHEVGGEEDLFTLAGYYEAEGRLKEAADAYARCAEQYPEGELGRRAAELLEPRRVRFDRLLSMPCAGKLFVVLRSLDLGLTSSQAEVSLVWVSEDRGGAAVRSLRLLPESRIEPALGEALPAVSGEPGSVIGTVVDLRTDTEYHISMEFPPIARDQKRVSLVIENDACGTGGRWGRHALRFTGLPIAGDAVEPGRDAEALQATEVAVFHIHDYFLAAGRCSGTLRFSPEGISYRSGPHSFELSCQEVIGVVQSSKTLAPDLLGRTEEVGTVPTLLVQGHGLTRKGKPKTEAWHFLAQDDTPPVLLLAKNLCRSQP